MRGISHSLAAYVGLLLAAPPVEAYTTAQHWFRHGHRIEHTLRLGPYDSYSSLFYDFKVERTPREALSLYRRLLVPSIIPRCALIQLSVYPLPTLPPYLNANFPDFYRRFEVKDGLNLVRVLASGAEEPYALSLFVGDIVPFVQKGTSGRQMSAAIMGIVGTVSWHRIVKRRNEDADIVDDIVRDVALELAWRVKGRVEREGSWLDWTFEVGPKFHSHREVVDVLVAGFRRQRNDARGEGSIWLRNSQIALETQFPIRNPGGVRSLVSRQSFLVGRRFPVGWPHVSAIRLRTGFLWEKRRVYDPSAGWDGDIQFLFRPTVDLH